MLRRTFSPSAFSLTRAMNFLATSKSTSASSNASRTWRSAASMFSSLIFPWPRRSLKISCSLSPSCENNLFLRRRGRRGLDCRTGVFDSERPVRLDFLIAGFRGQNNRATLIAEFLCHLVRNDTCFRVVSRWHQSQTAHPELDAARIDLANPTEIRFDEWQTARRRSIRGLHLQILRPDGCDRRRARSTATRGGNHFHRVLKNFRLVRFDGVTTERVQRRIPGNWLTINREHRFVTGSARDFFDVLVVIAKRNREAIYFDREPLLEQLFAADDFVLQPLLIFGASQFLLGPFTVRFHYHDGVTLAQILVCRGVRFDVDPVVAHVAQHLPGNGLTTAQTRSGNAFGVNEHREGVAEFFHKWPRDFVLRFPAVIERDHGAARRNIFLTALPCEEVLQTDDRDAAVLQHFHLLLEHRWRDLRTGIAHFVDQAVVAKDNRLGGLIDDRLGNSRRGRCRAGSFRRRRRFRAKAEGTGQKEGDQKESGAHN